MTEVLDPPASRNCSGPTTLDHVKDHPMMGRKAPTDEWHLVCLCFFHNAVDPPNKTLRAAERAYLADTRRETDQQGGGSDQPGVAEER
jgi:hypothetical protein